MDDEQLIRLQRYINVGFPNDRKNLPTDLHEFWLHREALSVESGLITCGSRIIIPSSMRDEMLRYIHEGHQDKERCLLRARNSVFWPKITYDIQQLIDKCLICQEFRKSQPIIGTTQELPPYPWHTIATDLFYWKRMEFLIVACVFSRYLIVRKLPNSTSTSVCRELSMIVTELGLPVILKSDNGPCYSSTEFQNFLQRYSILHQTSSPNHPRSNGFVERMVGVAKKLMDKSLKEGKSWISGLFDYRVTPQSGSIASPLGLMTQRTPRERCLPQLPSSLATPQMYQTRQELMKRQNPSNQAERRYVDLFPGTPVWVQHRQGATWELASAISQAVPNSYWIVQENGEEQPKVYRRSRHMLKIRTSSHGSDQITPERESTVENKDAKFRHLPTYSSNRNQPAMNSIDNHTPVDIQ